MIGKKYIIVLVFLCVVLWFLGNGILSGRIVEGKHNYACSDCNVVLIVVDTLRADHLSCYGYPYKTSPVIDSLAKNSAVFKNAFSQIPFTPPSHWSIMTGLYPFRHKMYLPQDKGENLTTLADVLKKNGYSTAAFVSSFMVSGIKKGFDVFDLPPRPSKTNKRMKRPRNATETTNMALEWMKNNKAKKFFLFVHYFDVHSPYAPPKSFDVFNYSESEMYKGKTYDYAGIGRGTIRDNIAKYDGEILYVDSNIGRIIEGIREMGIWNNTVIVITSDHGECFGEHNLSDFGYESKAICRFHGKTLFDEEVHIPLVIRVPGKRKVTIENIVESVDIMPGLLHILGITTKEDIDGTGLGLLGDVPRDYSVMQTLPRTGGSYSIAVRNWKWKLVRVHKKDGSNTEVLFSVPGDMKQDAKAQNYVMRKLSEMLENDLKGATIGPVEFAINKTVEQKLRKEGYIA